MPRNRRLIRQSSVASLSAAALAHSLAQPAIFDSIIAMSSVAAARATQDVTAKGKHEVRQRPDRQKQQQQTDRQRSGVRSFAHVCLPSALSASPSLQTILLRANIQDQLNRLLTQLEDLEELKDGQDERRDGCRAIGCSPNSVQSSLAVAERLTWALLSRVCLIAHVCSFVRVQCGGVRRDEGGDAGPAARVPGLPRAKSARRHDARRRVRTCTTGQKKKWEWRREEREGCDSRAVAESAAEC